MRLSTLHRNNDNHNSGKPKTHHHHRRHHSTEDLPIIMVKDNFLSVVAQQEESLPPMTKASYSDESTASDPAVEHRQEEPSSPNSRNHATTHLLSPVMSKQQKKATLHRRLESALRHEDWDRLEELCEHHPSLARDPISMVCQGENSNCLPIHFCAGQKSTPVSAIDGLVTAHPSSLLATESRGGRLPLHIAVLKGASFAVVRYLCEALPQSMGIKDQEGNLPLHYAAMYSSDEILQLMVRAYPQACRVVNQSDRLPLHLLCARCWDRHAIATETVQAVLTEYPEALRCADRRGRLPLHVCCSSQDPRAEMVQLLVPAYPEALLTRDQSKGTPLDLARQFSAGGGVVVAYLQDYTNRERRKKYKFLAPFKHVGGKIARRRHCKPDVDALHLHYCYG